MSFDDAGGRISKRTLPSNKSVETGMPSLELMTTVGGGLSRCTVSGMKVASRERMPPDDSRGGGADDVIVAFGGGGGVTVC